MMNKTSGGNGIPDELLQILKDDAVKVLHSVCQQIWKTQQWPQDCKRSVFIPILKEGHAKECSNYCTIALISHARLPWWIRWQSVCLQFRRLGLDTWVRKIPWRRKWQPTPVLLPRKSHGRRSLVSMGSQRVRHDGATSLSHARKVMLKILQARLQQYVN